MLPILIGTISLLSISLISSVSYKYYKYRTYKILKNNDLDNWINDNTRTSSIPTRYKYPKE